MGTYSQLPISAHGVHNVDSGSFTGLLGRTGGVVSDFKAMNQYHSGYSEYQYSFTTLTFDVSSLPSGAIITSATLSIMPQGNIYDDDGFDLRGEYVPFSTSPTVTLSNSGNAFIKDLSTFTKDVVSIIPLSSLNNINQGSTISIKINITPTQPSGFNQIGTYNLESLTLDLEYITKTKIGEVRYNAGTLPIYDPAIGMDGKNQLRINTPSGVGCYELVDTTDPNASPLRVQTSTGVKSIAKE